MKTYSLQFLNEDTETMYQEQQHIRRIGVLKIYMTMKWTLAILDIIIHFTWKSPLGSFKQGIVGFTLFSIYLIIILRQSVQVSMMVNIMQVSTPIINLIINNTWPFIQDISSENLFMFGGFKTINAITLYVLGYTYKSNSLCFIFSSIIYSYLESPQNYSYNVTNYLGSLIWVVVLKYINDKDRRNQFLLTIKDVQWTYIMKDMIDDWVIMVTYNPQMDQIRFRDANQNFKKSCNVNDDKNFRTFVRSIQVQTLSSYKNSFNQQENQQIEERIKESLSSRPFNKITATNKYHDLEQILMENLIINENQNFQNQSPSLKSRKVSDVYVKQFFGIGIDKNKKSKQFFSIRMIKGSGHEPFIFLVIKKQKQESNSNYLSKSEIFKYNLSKMSNICKQYSDNTLRVYQEIQNKNKNHWQKTKIMSNLTSQLFSVLNSHYIHQLYLNQMHNFNEFEFKSSMQSINLKEIINKLKTLKKSQIQIIFKQEAHQNITIHSFQRELFHLFLILIENTIKHSKLQHPSILIEYSQEKEYVKFKFQDKGQGINATLLKQLISSYEINISQEKKIKILDHNSFDEHLMRKMRHGWIAARIILSFLSPYNTFEVTSNLYPNQDCSIIFCVYNNLSNIMRIRDRCLYIQDKSRKVL